MMKITFKIFRGLQSHGNPRSFLTEQLLERLPEHDRYSLLIHSNAYGNVLANCRNLNNKHRLDVPECLRNRHIFQYTVHDLHFQILNIHKF